MVCLQHPIQVQTVITPSSQRALFQRTDGILSASGPEEEFIALTLAERAVSIHSATASCLERFAKYSALVHENELQKQRRRR